MDEDRFPQQMRSFAARAIDEAAGRGSPTVEVEHFLLALTTYPASEVTQKLSAVGLDHDAVEAALVAERVQSLAVAGVSAIDPALLSSTSARRTRPTWGASIRGVMDGMRRDTVRDRGSRKIEIDFAVAILRVELGTVPRALAIAGYDRLSLIEQLRYR